jgi:hypothetical protein
MKTRKTRNRLLCAITLCSLIVAIVSLVVTYRTVGFYRELYDKAYAGIVSTHINAMQADVDIWSRVPVSYLKMEDGVEMYVAGYLHVAFPGEGSVSLANGAAIVIGDDVQINGVSYSGISLRIEEDGSVTKHAHLGGF